MCVGAELTESVCILVKKLKDAAELSNREEEFVLLEHERKRISKAVRVEHLTVPRPS